MQDVVKGNTNQRGKVNCEIIIAIVAAVAVLVVALFIVNRNGSGGKNDGPNSVEEYDYSQKYNTSLELSDAVSDRLGKLYNRKVNYTIEDLTMPFEVVSTEYVSNGEGVGKIIFKAEDQTAEYYKTVGDYRYGGSTYDNKYGLEKVIYIGENSVGLRGKEETYTWANWTDGIYVYEMTLEKGITVSDMKSIINQVVEKSDKIRTQLEYHSVDELNQTLGYSVEDINGVAQLGNNVKYKIYGNTMAMIQSDNINETVMRANICKSPMSYNMVDNYFRAQETVPFSSQKNMDVIKVNDIDVIMRGGNAGTKQYLLAYWNDGDYNYFVKSEKYVTETVMIDLIDKIMKSK